jgi:mono/diheme cytochrome c family protein
MMRISGQGLWMLPLCAIFLPATLAAQSPSSSSQRTLNEQQKIGKNLFLQNCQVCHLPEKENMKNTKEEGKTIGPRLDVLMKGPKPLTDSVIRKFIVNGSEEKMPAFKYTLESREIDAIVAYLKAL